MRRICSIADGTRYSRKLHEGFDRGQPDVSRACSVAACGFQIVQEIEHQRRIDLLHRQPGWRSLEALAGEG